MTRLLVLALLVLVMLEVDLLQGTVDESAIDSLTFAAIGFVVLAAHALAELAASITLPRVTGYILAGIVLGPQVGGLLGAHVVEDLQVFNTLALALIALEAGLELELGAIRRVARTLGSIVAFKIPLAWLMVGGAFLAASPLLPWAEGMSWPTLLAIALVLGALSIGTSPAVSVAVISESGVKSRTADLVLSLAVFKDLVMIIMLAVSIAVAGALTSPGEAMDMSLFTEVALKVGLSIGAGVLLGGLLIGWFRWVRWQPVLLLLVLGYGVNTVADVLHLKMLLVFIAAGFTVTNFSSYGERLHEPLALLAVPVFILFFTTVGAGLDLVASLAVLPVGGILFVARAGMLFTATRLGGRLAGESRAFSNNLTQGLLSQAGVALGLLLVAREALPDLAEPLGQVATVLISLNLLVGPVLLRRALDWGETSPDAGEEHPAAPEPAPVLPGPEDEGLREIVVRVGRELEEFTRRVDRDLISAWAAEGSRRLDAFQLGPPVDEVEDAEHRPRAIPLAEASASLWEAVRDLRNALDELPIMRRAAVGEHHHRAWRGMGPWRRLALASWRPLHPVGSMRRVPVRVAIRGHVEGHLVPFMADLLRELARLEARRLVLEGEIRSRLARRGDQRIMAAVLEQRAWLAAASGKLRTHLERITDRGRAEAAYALRRAGTPALPRPRLAYRRVAREVDEALSRIAREGASWDRVEEAVSGRVAIDITLARLEASLSRRVEAAIGAWRERHRNVVSRIADVRDGLAVSQQTLGRGGGAPEVADAREVLEGQIETIDRVMVAELLPHIREAQGEEGGVADPLADIGRHIEASLEEVPGRVRAVPASLDVDTMESPTEVPADVVPLRAVAHQYLAGELLWLGDARDDADQLVDRAVQRLGEVAGITTHGLRVALAHLGGGEAGRDEVRHALSLAAGAMRRASRTVETLQRELDAREEAIARSIHSSLDDALSHVRDQAREPKPARRLQRRRRVRRFLRAAVRLVPRLWRRFVGLGDAIRRTLGRAERSQIIREARIRQGLVRVDPSTMAEALRPLDVSPEQRATVPYVLAQLFDTRAFDLPQAPTGAEHQIATFEEAWQRFEQGRPSSVLFSGSHGSGVSNVARMALRPLAGRRLVTIGLDPMTRTEAGLVSVIGTGIGAWDVKDFGGLETALLERRPAILLHGLEQTFVRTPEGLAHLRRFLRMVLRTRHQVFWAVGVVLPTARLLERLVNLEDYFTDHVTFPPLDALTLQEVVESRCHLSGFQVAWPSAEARSELARSRVVRRLVARRPEDRRRRFYQALTVASAGNVRDALALWLNAVEYVEHDTIHLRNVRAPSTAWFDQLGRDAHHLAALAVLCGSLTRAEAAEALRWSPDRVDAAAAVLAGAGLVDSPGNGGRFSLWPPAWGCVTRELEARRLLVTSPPEEAP
ncbi:MAG: cation:proton antiporter [Myxococcota bacterium]